MTETLGTLGDTVDRNEAHLIAERTFDCASRLQRAYELVWPPQYHNFLVTMGWRKRGLCFHFAEDLYADLKQLPLSSLTLHWGMARPGTWFEHNCIVVCARGQRFENGVAIDLWRRSGEPSWVKVKSDRYNWQEGELLPP